MKRQRLVSGVAGAVLLGLSAGAAMADGPARLVKDIDQAPSSVDRSSFPDTFHAFGSLTLFRASTHDAGAELWKTDGTSGGTTLVKDIQPGMGGGLDWHGGDGGFVDLNGKVLFPADDGVHGTELWTSDGTEAGTFLVKDIAPEARGGLSVSDTVPASVWQHREAGGVMYFLANDGVHGFELWRTDGTEAGTALVKDIRDGSTSAFRLAPATALSFDAAAVGPILFFRADDGINGVELWKTDGTGTGTMLVKDINPGPHGAFPGSLTELDGRVVFVAAGSDNNNELWRSDGTIPGTVLVDDIILGSNPRQLTKVGGFIYFKSSNSLYRTDGTFEGTVLLLNAGPYGVQPLGELNGSLFFSGDDGVHGPEPWISNGIPDGTAMIKDLRPGSGGSSPFTYSQSGGVAYFLSDDGLHLNLWRSDGTEAGTRLVADLTGSFIPSISIAPFGAGGILFTNKQTLWRVDPGIDEAVPVKALANPGGLTVLSGRIFLTADGTEAGTRMLKDVNPFLRTAPSYPEFLGVANGPAGPRLVFDAYDGVHGLQLFATDGTGAGTTPLKPIVSVDTDAATATLNGVLYFDAMDDEHGLELWRSDGTADGTWMVKDLDPGEGFGIFGTPVVYHGRLYFTGSDGGRAGLWTTDGTDADTSILTAMEAQDFVVAGDTLFFEGFGNSYPTLWRTDGTVAGTRVVTDAFLDCCSLMAPFQGTLLVGANDGVHGEEPWLSDGTQEGTRLLKDIAPGGDSTYFWTGPLPGVTEAGGFGYFGADDGIHGIELWRTDGTESGTTMVKDIRPGSASSFPRVLGVLGDTVVIASFTGTLESELWTTDGTEAGTTMLRAYPDVSPYSAVMVDGRILFAETDAEHGRELWRTDGTAAGTVLVQDIAPGPDSSAPQSLQRVGSRILFMADDPIANVEPFAGRAAILAGRPDQGVRDLADEVKAARLPKGVGSALSAKLNAASAALAAGSTTEAILDLEDFVKNVQVQTPRKIDAATAGELIDFAQDLVRMLEGDFNP